CPVQGSRLRYHQLQNIVFLGASKCRHLAHRCRWRMSALTAESGAKRNRLRGSKLLPARREPVKLNAFVGVSRSVHLVVPDDQHEGHARSGVSFVIILASQKRPRKPTNQIAKLREHSKRMKGKRGMQSHD